MMSWTRVKGATEEDLERRLVVAFEIFAAEGVLNDV